ncbi:unnamed protein product [Cuscuta epithymum]|uniref:Pollen Ole e 1 allergen and extensin family protein n=1 Tax=Cuscuta epithymum TaxID=186058 RepID=A0AAV0DXX0_9ASTE|nr:unnamed protein product [Cuscuta epithymum]
MVKGTKIMTMQFHGGRVAVVVAISLILLTLFFIILDSPAIGDHMVQLSNSEEEVHMAGYGEEKISIVLIDGVVLCNSCGGDKNRETRNRLRRHLPRPVSGAFVSVFCGGLKEESWATNITNEYGEFVIDLPSEFHAMPELEKMCLVKVIRLPQDSVCHNPSFVEKHKNIKLATIHDIGFRRYTTHNIHMSDKSCK